MTLRTICLFVLPSLLLAAVFAPTATSQIPRDIKEPVIPGAKSYRPPPVPAIAGLKLAEAKRDIDAYAARATELIDSMARSEHKDPAEDRLDAQLDDIQDLLAQGKLDAAKRSLDAFAKAFETTAKKRGKALRTRAFKAVIRSHLAGDEGHPRIPDRATFERLAFQGDDGLIEPHLRGTQYIKFWISRISEGKPRMHFFDTNVFRSHKVFLRAAGAKTGHGKEPKGGRVPDMLGSLCYRPLLTAADGTRGLYTFEFDPYDLYPFSLAKLAYDKLIETAPVVRNRLAFYPFSRGLALYERDKRLYEKANLPVVLAQDLYGDVAFRPLNHGAGCGRLRVMKSGERPSARDIVVYPKLPNEMPRVAGVITGEHQTPLSHVNLRAVQDRVPNAFIRGAAENADIKVLVGEYVRYEVTGSNYTLRKATAGEVEAHFADIRPKEQQVPERDLSVTRIRALDEVTFADATNVGAKAAGVATLRTLGFPDVTVPDGFAVPFSFYDGFMRHNGLDAAARAMRAAPGFRKDTAVRRKALARHRARIMRGEWPKGMRDALAKVQESFPKGTRIRCRSSTNNEDLPGFSGAGLYDSFTHKDAKTHLAETIRKVYASLWNFRAFEERDFWRVDHDATAMGVLVHPSYRGEKANGVAVTDDVLYESPGRRYYVNVQVGEDMVTNPRADSIAEELLLSPVNPAEDIFVRRSNRTKGGARVLADEHKDQLRRHLGRIHRKFRRLHGRSRSSGRFAVEVEFKITAEGELAIKQVRPWVY